MQPDTVDHKTDLKDKIFEIGRTLAALEPGALAELRREQPDAMAPHPAYFWRLAARHKLYPSDETRWVRIIRIMAILTEKGNSEGKKSPHAAKSHANGWRGLGAALCDGADTSWGASQSDPRPMLSELRFARLLAAKGEMRAVLMERAARALAAKKPAGAGVDCIDLAKFLLYDTDPVPARNLARDYYARLDRSRNANASDDAEIPSDTGDNV